VGDKIDFGGFDILPADARRRCDRRVGLVGLGTEATGEGIANVPLSPLRSDRQIAAETESRTEETPEEEFLLEGDCGIATIAAQSEGGKIKYKTEAATATTAVATASSSSSSIDKKKENDEDGFCNKSEQKTETSSKFVESNEVGASNDSDAASSIVSSSSDNYTQEKDVEVAEEEKKDDSLSAAVAKESTNDATSVSAAAATTTAAKRTEHGNSVNDDGDDVTDTNITVNSDDEINSILWMYDPLLNITIILMFVICVLFAKRIRSVEGIAGTSRNADRGDRCECGSFRSRRCCYVVIVGVVGTKIQRRERVLYRISFLDKNRTSVTINDTKEINFV